MLRTRANVAAQAQREIYHGLMAQLQQSGIRRPDAPRAIGDRGSRGRPEGLWATSAPLAFHDEGYRMPGSGLAARTRMTRGPPLPHRSARAWPPIKAAV